MTPALDDELAAAAAPPVRERTPGLRAAVREMIEDTEQRSRPTTGRLAGRRRTAGLVLTATTLLGTATTAAAAGWLPEPWWESDDAVVQPATSASGAECSVTFAARPITDLSHPVTDEERAAALSAAEQFLRDLDHGAITVRDPDTAFQTLNRQLTAELRLQGLSTYAVSVALASDCSDGGDR